MREFQRADTTAIASAVRSFLQVGVMAAVISVCLMAVMGFRFGVKKSYSAAHS